LVNIEYDAVTFMQIHNNPQWCSRNSLATFFIFPLILFGATRNTSDTAWLFVVLLVVLLPMWVKLGKLAKTIQVTAEGIVINCCNRSVVQILWSDITRVEGRPYRTLAGPRLVYIYSKSMQPIPFCDSISDYQGLLVSIREHVNRQIMVPAPPTKRRDDQQARSVLVGALLIFATLGELALAIVSATAWPRFPLATLVLLFGAFAVPLITAVLFANRIVAVARSVRDMIVADTAFFCILFGLLAAKVGSSDPHLTALFISAAIISCLTGLLALYMVKRAQRPS
jgi:hypothetical protein